MSWFVRTKPAQFLVLFVGGGKRDRFWYEEMIKHAETIDVLSGRIADIYMFYDGQKEYLDLDAPLNPLSKLLRGKSLSPEYQGPDGFGLRSVQEMDLEERKLSIVRKSISVSSEIVSYFKIPLDDLPCIVVSTGFAEESFVIPTFDHADIKTLFSLLKDLAKVNSFSVDRGAVEECNVKGTRQAIEVTLKNVDKLYTRLIQESGAHQGLHADFEAVHVFMPQIQDVTTPLTVSNRQRLEEVFSKRLTNYTGTGANKEVARGSLYPPSRSLKLELFPYSPSYL